MLGSSRVFLLSPAHVGGKRAGYLFNPNADFPLALRFQRGGVVTLGEAFSFLSGLYFRGKLTYASRFATTADMVFVITSNRGLLPADTPITVPELQAFGAVDIDVDDERYRGPLERDLARLAARELCEVVLLGSIATPKYVELLAGHLGDRLRYPADFVGLGDMSRGAILLKAARAGVELPYRAWGDLTVAPPSPSSARGPVAR
jgi:hypothetical protein